MKSKLNLQAIFLLLILFGCGKSTEEKNEIAILTCNILKSPDITSSERIKEVNTARETVGQERFLLNGEIISEAIQEQLCEPLILMSDSEFLTRLVEEKSRKTNEIILKMTEIFKGWWEEYSCDELNDEWDREDVEYNFSFEEFFGADLTAEDLENLPDNEGEYFSLFWELKEKPHFENLFKRQNEVLISLALQCNLDDKSRSYMDEYYDTQLRLLNDYFKSN